ncbi:MAG: efflux RND transporter permease subunit [Oligoflexales bacterium]|nr:efflux RND transporter permease subunit [Oligoflexales bacterium]
MLLSDVSIKRPVFATMLNLVLIVFGLFSLPRLAVDQFPNVDFPVVTVTVVYPGADPESVEQRVLKPLEDALKGLAGLELLSSTGFPNVAQLMMRFKLNKNSDQAAQEVRDKVFAAVGKLPPEAETPIVQKFDVGGMPILNIAVSGSSSIPYGQLSQVTDDVVKSALERVNGVASIEAAGIRLREVQIFVDRERLASFGLTPADISNSLAQQNLDAPVGKIQNDRNYLALRVKGKLRSGNEIAQLPIISRLATKLRISDVATIKDTIAEEQTAAFVGKTPTILLSVQKVAGANTPGIAADTRKTLAKLEKLLPPGIKAEVITDNSTYIKGSIDAVKLDLVLGAILATIIVFVFLRNFWITVISAVALPTAVIGTFAFLEYMGFTLNMMTTLGLSLSIGILIDDAIIVIENIHRHLSMGKSGEVAARDATAEIGLAVMATTLTILAVFVPVAFMEGIIGRFFYQFGLTVAFAVAISLFVAFTLAPMLSARLLKPGDHKPENPHLLKGWEAVETALTWLDTSYKHTLGWCLSHRKTTLAVGAVSLIISFLMLRFVPVSFFPKEDRSQFAITYTLKEGTSLDAAKVRSAAFVDALSVYPGIEKVVTAIGATRERKPSIVRFDVVLVGTNRRNFSQDDLMSRLRDDLGPKFATDGAELTIADAGMGGGGPGGRTEPLQFILTSDNWESLVTFSDKAAAFVKENISGAVEVKTSKPKIQRELRIAIDPSRAADLEVSTAQIATTLRALYEGDKISEIEEKGTSYDVRMRIADKDRFNAQDIAGVALTNRRGEQISLGAIASLLETDAPSSIERFDGQRQIMLLANFTGKDLNKASSRVLEYINQNMPPDVSVRLSGQTEMMKDAIGAILRALAIAVLLVFMILCAQYERYLAPLVIMAALPLSLTGAFGSLLITGQVMSVFTMIGIILLMGIVTKNGILLIDFTLQRIAEGKPVDQALMEAGPIRLRPILMTTFAAGAGMIPIAIGHGDGGESKAPMGIAVIGGLMMSTLLTLVVVPCLFSLVEEWRTKLRGRFIGVGSKV